MLRAYKTLGEGMVFEVADNLSLGFDRDIDRVIMEGVTIVMVFNFP